MTSPLLPRPVRAVGLTLLWVLAILLVLSVVAVGWVAVRGAIAADHLRSARGAATAVVANIDDPAAVAASIDDIAEDTSAARALTSDPIWRGVEALPWIGPQLRAVSVIAASADQVATDALTPLAEVAATLPADAFRPVDGRVQLDGFVAVQDAAATAAAAMSEATDAVTRANSPALVAPLRAVVDEVEELFDQTDRATDALARASVLIPAMLGADGPRNYLVLFQNNAEWRSLGGIAGAMSIVRTDGGALALGAQDYAAAFGRFDPPAVDLPADVMAVYGASPASWMHNVTEVADFALTGQIAQAMWADKHGTEVDGVLALDPVALSYILEATGPVALPSGDTLTSENAVSLLLNEVYVRYPDPAEQNAFFTEATSAVFTALIAGRIDASALLEALARAGDENRVMIWSAHDDDQSVLEPTSIAGRLPVSDGTTTSLGVYLNDGTGSKMDFYQSVQTEAAWAQCTLNAAGAASGTVTLDVTITNDAPDGLPEYITGGGAYGVSPGSAQTLVYLYVPDGFELVDATLSTPGEEEAGFGGGEHDGWQVLSYDVLLAPGESATAHLEARTTRPSGAQLDVRQTPTVNADVTHEVARCL